VTPSPVRLAAAFALLLLSAPATAMAAALPDWSGVWAPIEGNLFDPASGSDANLDGAHDKVPYTAEYAAKYRYQLDETAAGRPRDPTAACLPPGMPRLMVVPYPFEAEIGRDRVVFLHEYQSQVRRVFTDRREHLPELDSSFNGDSIGHWEGDTLVIETVGLRADTVLDRTAAPHSAELKVEERIRKVKPDVLEDRLTLTDPKALTRPWTVVRTYKRRPDWRIFEYACQENNRNPVDATGGNGFVLQNSSPSQ
jgi:hypothetical protein